MKNKAIIAACYGLTLGLLTTNLLAHGGATGIVKERMELMKDMKTSMKSLTEIFKGQVAYDAHRVRDAALALQNTAGKKLIMLFPEGSLHKPSEAKAEIWQDWDRFESLADRLEQYSAALSAAADNHTSGSGAESSKPQGGSSNMMMGSNSSMMMGSTGRVAGEGLSAAELGKMPADKVFKMVVDTCSSCHTRFRIEKED